MLCTQESLLHTCVTLTHDVLQCHDLEIVSCWNSSAVYCKITVLPGGETLPAVTPSSPISGKELPPSLGSPRSASAWRGARSAMIARLTVTVRTFWDGSMLDLSSTWQGSCRVWGWVLMAAKCLGCSVTTRPDGTCCSHCSSRWSRGGRAGEGLSLPLWWVLAHLGLRKLWGRAVLEPQLAWEETSHNKHNVCQLVSSWRLGGQPVCPVKDPKWKSPYLHKIPPQDSWEQLLCLHWWGLCPGGGGLTLCGAQFQFCWSHGPCGLRKAKHDIHSSVQAACQLSPITANTLKGWWAEEWVFCLPRAMGSLVARHPVVSSAQHSPAVQPPKFCQGKTQPSFVHI